MKSKLFLLTVLLMMSGRVAVAALSAGGSSDGVERPDGTGTGSLNYRLSLPTSFSADLLRDTLVFAELEPYPVWGLTTGLPAAPGIGAAPFLDVLLFDATPIAPLGASLTATEFGPGTPYYDLISSVFYRPQSVDGYKLTVAEVHNVDTLALLALGLLGLRLRLTRRAGFLPVQRLLLK